MRILSRLIVETELINLLSTLGDGPRLNDLQFYIDDFDLTHIATSLDDAFRAKGIHLEAEAATWDNDFIPRGTRYSTTAS